MEPWEIDPDDLRKMALIERFTLGDIKEVLNREDMVGTAPRIYELLERFSKSLDGEYNNGEIISFGLALISAQMLLMYEHFEKGNETS